MVKELQYIYPKQYCPAIPECILGDMKEKGNVHKEVLSETVFQIKY